MDKFYNLVPLTKALTSKTSYVCGTFRSNRKENPKDVMTKKLKKGEIVGEEMMMLLCASGRTNEMLLPF